MPEQPLLLRLRKELQRAADPVKAPVMQAYMKSTMPYHGVPTPALQKITKEVFADLRLESAAAWQTRVLELWRNAKFREERYAAGFQG